MKIPPRTCLQWAAGAAAVPALSSAASAQEVFPSRPIRLIAIDKVATAAAGVMHAPDAVETLKKQGFEPMGTTPEAFAPYLQAEIRRWAEVARAAGVKS